VSREICEQRLGGTMGYMVTVKDIVTFGFGLTMSGNLLYEGHLPQAPTLAIQRDLTFSWGSVQTLGFRPIPLAPSVRAALQHTRARGDHTPHLIPNVSLFRR
jgi:hypothetical protein